MYFFLGYNKCLPEKDYWRLRIHFWIRSQHDSMAHVSLYNIIEFFKYILVYINKSIVVFNSFINLIIMIKVFMKF